MRVRRGLLAPVPRAAVPGAAVPGAAVPGAPVPGAAVRRVVPGSAGTILAAGPAIAAAVALALTGCSSTVSRPHAAGTPASGAHSAAVGHSSAKHSSARQGAGPGRGRPGPVTFCLRRPGSGLRAALDRTVRRSLRAEVLPLGISAGGRAAYVSIWSHGYSGVAEMNLASGALRRIRTFADPASDQADGAASGNWLVWAETYSLRSLDEFTVYAFDAATGTLRRLGHSLAGPSGTAWPSPWHAPAVSGHYAAWAQGYGPGGLVEIRLANLLTGRVTVISKGHLQPPFFDGSLVVWPESDRPGGQTTLAAWSLVTSRPAPLPAVLRGVHGTEFVATDGAQTAYLSPDLTGLYYSPAQDQPARMMLKLPPGEDFSGLAIQPGSLTWTTTSATYLASTRTGAYTPVTRQYGYATGSGSVVLVSDAPAGKSARPILPLHVVDAASISWPGCRRGTAR
jgi:hypothetical protein